LPRVGAIMTISKYNPTERIRVSFKGKSSNKEKKTRSRVRGQVSSSKRKPSKLGNEKKKRGNLKKNVIVLRHNGRLRSLPQCPDILKKAGVGIGCREKKRKSDRGDITGKGESSGKKRTPCFGPPRLTCRRHCPGNTREKQRKIIGRRQNRREGAEKIKEEGGSSSRLAAVKSAIQGWKINEKKKRKTGSSCEL